MEMYDVVKKLLGPIEPIGETHADDDRFANLQATCILVDKLLSDINQVVSYKNCAEYSRSRAGKKANGFFMQIKEQFSTD